MVLNIGLDKVIDNIEQDKQNSEEITILKKDLRILIHDIQKPMTPLLGFSQILAEELPEGDLKEYAKKVHISSKHTVYLFRELRDSLMVLDGQIEPNLSSVNLNNLLDEVGNYVENSSTNCRKNIHLIKTYISDQPKIYSDELKLMRILYNLVSNATEFTKDTIEMGFTKGPVNNGYVMYSGFVRDNGPGISEQIQEQLKKEEYLLQKNPKRINSDGIGLKRSKQLASMLGGEWGFNSTQGKGTTFWFTFRDMYNEYEKLYPSKKVLQSYK